MIIEINEEFIELSGFTKKDLLNMPLEMVWKELFRININIEHDNEEIETFMFTKDLESRCITICKHKDNGLNSCVYKFKEKPKSRLEDTLSYPLQILSENIVGVAIYSVPDFILLKANQVYIDFFNTPFDKLQSLFGKQMKDFNANFLGNHSVSAFDKVVKTGQSIYLNEYEHNKLASGTTYWNEIITPIKLDGEIKYIVVNMQEITNKVSDKNSVLEDVLRESSEKYGILFENMDEGYAIFEVVYDDLENPIDYRYMEINKVYEEQTGIKANDIVGKTLLEIAPDMENTWTEMLSKVATTRKCKQYTDYNQSTDRYYNSFTFSHKRGYVVIVIKDITKSRKLEKESKHQNELLEAIIENMHDALVIYNHKGDIVFLNAETRKMYPYLNNQTAVGNVKNRYECFDLENNRIAKEDLPTARAFRGEKITNERVIIKLFDKDQYTEINATPIFDSEGNLSYVIVSHRDISEFILHQKALKEQQEQLLRIEKEKNETLKASIKLKDEFFYLISHEFKTPIAVISSVMQSIDSFLKEDVTERLGRYLNMVKMNTNRQLRLVNNLLDITRISSGNVKLDKHKYDIVYLTRAIVNSVEVYASHKNIKLNFTSNIAKREKYIDEEKFERIMLNLLSNALKFTPQGKSISVSVRVKKYKGENFISISVKDEGIGIPSEKEKIIFERFGQADTSMSRHAEGTGLGLHLVNLLVQSLGGEICLKSKEGQGSTFTILLPEDKVQDYDEVAASKETNNQIVNSDERIIQAISVEFSDIYFD